MPLDSGALRAAGRESCTVLGALVSCAVPAGLLVTAWISYPRAISSGRQRRSMKPVPPVINKRLVKSPVSAFISNAEKESDSGNPG